jgi:hypothetical protein
MDEVWWVGRTAAAMVDSKWSLAELGSYADEQGKRI